LLVVDVFQQFGLYLLDPDELLVDSLDMLVEFHFLLGRVSSVEGHGGFVEGVDLLLEGVLLAS